MTLQYFKDKSIIVYLIITNRRKGMKDFWKNIKNIMSPMDKFEEDYQEKNICYFLFAGTS